MTAVETLPDVEGAVVALLKANAAVTATVGQRSFFGVPKEPTWPLNVVQRIGGGDDESEVPFDVALVQIDCWGTISDRGFGVKAACTAQMNAVRSALRSIAGSATYAGVTIFAATVQSVIWLPDPSNDRPRYSLTVEVSALSS